MLFLYFIIFYHIFFSECFWVDHFEPFWEILEYVLHVAMFYGVLDGFGHHIGVTTKRPGRTEGFRGDLASGASGAKHGTSFCSLCRWGAWWNCALLRCQLAMDQYLLIPFLVGWTSIYQLFWCSPGVQGFDTLPIMQAWRVSCKNLRGQSCKPWSTDNTMLSNVVNMSWNMCWDPDQSFSARSWQSEQEACTGKFGSLDTNLIKFIIFIYSHLFHDMKKLLLKGLQTPPWNKTLKCFQASESTALNSPSVASSQAFASGVWTCPRQLLCSSSHLLASSCGTWLRQMALPALLEAQMLKSSQAQLEKSSSCAEGRSTVPAQQMGDPVVRRKEVRAPWHLSLLWCTADICWCDNVGAYHSFLTIPNPYAIIFTAARSLQTQRLG